MVNIASAVRSLCESQARWKATMERLAEVLARARSIQSTPPLGVSGNQTT